MHVVGTAGHVDHGKSALVRALTGIDPDRLAAEKQRGLTIDLGFAWCTLPSGREIGIVDVPGHERFIRNMLAGVGGIDAVLFVVAADEGWMPQSAEHLAIIDFLQVRGGAVALTKADLVDPETLALAAEEVTEHLRGTVLEGVAVQPVSSVTGQGLDELRELLDAALERLGPPPDRGRPRLYVDRSFIVAGAGTVVTGTLTGGSLRTGDEVEVLPDGHRARIRSLQTHRRPVAVAVPGSRVAANLAGLPRTGVRRGDAVVLPGQWRTTRSFAAHLRAARDLAHRLTERGAWELHTGSAELPCRLRLLDPPDPAGLRAGEACFVQVFIPRPLPLEPGDRFVLRDAGRWRTVGGGVVVDHLPGRLRRRDPGLTARLQARLAAGRGGILRRVVAERHAVPKEDLPWLCGLGAAEIDAAVQAALQDGALLQTATHLVDAGYAESLRSRAVSLLQDFHAAHRLEAGMPRESLRAALSVDGRLFAELLSAWSQGGSLVAEGVVVRLASHTTHLSEAEEAAARRALELLRQGGASPPDPRRLGISPELLRALERRGDVVRVGPDLVYAADSLAELERVVARFIATHGAATVAQIRDAVGTTRRYAVPLLEHFDATGLTRRQGDLRVLGPRGRALAG